VLILGGGRGGNLGIAKGSVFLTARPGPWLPVMLSRWMLGAEDIVSVSDVTEEGVDEGRKN